MYDSEKIRAAAEAMLRPYADGEDQRTAAAALKTEAVWRTFESEVSPETVLELLDEIERLRRDAERLDFLIDQRVWVQWTVRDGSIRQCQVYDQNEDEEYLVVSGEDRYFNTPREAIDAARTQGGDA